MLRVAARQLEERLNQDHSDYRGATRPCACGQQARYVGRRAKRFPSVLGELNLKRAYYHCSGCGQGCCPRDQALGLQGASLSPGVQRMVASVGAAVSFEEGSTLLRELAGVEVNAKQVERVAERLGAEIAEGERRTAEPLSDRPSAPTLYLGVDGTGVPMRPTELRGRAGKQPDGSAKTREVKLCTVWSAESRDAEGRPVRDEGSVSYSAAVESAATRDTDRELSDFTQRVEREATRRRCRDTVRLVILGDAAPWIWNQAGDLFPQAIQIVDRFHVKERLSQVAKSLYGETSEEAKRWAERRHQELDEGRWKNLLAALLRHALHSKAARDGLQYLRRNRQRMRYPEFHAQGLCTSSGVVEAGCKVVVGTRLKRAGMHWTVRGANAIIALRCCKLSGRFEDFWEQRSRNRKVA
ncbi:MAG: ISKra4 family transposase [Terriglobia bacterium]